MKTVELIDLMDDDQHRLALELAGSPVLWAPSGADDVLAAAVLAEVVEHVGTEDDSEMQVKIALSVTEGMRDRLVEITDKLEEWLRQLEMSEEEAADYRRYGRKGLPEGNEE